MGLIGLNANGYQGMNNWTSGQSVRNNAYAKLQADQIELKEACKEYIANGGTQAEFENTYSEEIEAWKAAYEAYTSGADETSYESTGINAELKTHKDTLKNNPQINSKVLLYSTGNYNQSSGITHNGKEYKKECIYN